MTEPTPNGEPGETPTEPDPRPADAEPPPADAAAASEPDVSPDAPPDAALADGQGGASFAGQTTVSLPAVTDPAHLVRYEEFAHVLQGHQRILVLTHNNPDPDAMASAIGLYTMLREAFKLEVRIGHGGTIGRAENKAMVRDLDMPVYAVNLLDLTNFDGVILVDTQFETGYHALPSEQTPLAVFDHHPPIAAEPKGVFIEIQPTVGSTSAIITQYLLASGVEYDSKVATALMYGIRTDTLNFFRHANEWDLSAHQALFPKVDHTRLAAIETPPLPREYYIDLRTALESAQVHGELVLTDLKSVNSSDMIALVSDLMLRFEPVHWAITVGLVDREMRVSVRTSREDADAGKFVRQLIRNLGTGGGHGEMAAAQIPLTAQREDVQYDIVAKELLGRAIRQLGAPETGKLLTRPKAIPPKSSYTKKPPATGSGLATS